MSQASELSDSDEILCLYQDGKVVSIEGPSLWMEIRLRGTTSGPNNGTPFFLIVDGGSMSFISSLSCKKWQFSNQELVKDLISLGSGYSKDLIPLNAKKLIPTAILCPFRFVSVGSNPMVAVYATLEDVKSFRNTNSVASKVGTAVSS